MPDLNQHEWDNDNPFPFQPFSVRVFLSDKTRAMANTMRRAMGLKRTECCTVCNGTGTMRTIK